MKVPPEFQKRRSELLALEGWYDTGTYKFKLSCRYHDILRCSEFNGKTRHFTSCFEKDRLHEEQPLYRCLDPNWAIIYTPDKHGNFLGRCFVHLEVNNETKESELVIDKIYGNQLTVEDIKMKIIGLNVAASRSDTYLNGKAS